MVSGEIGEDRGTVDTGGCQSVTQEEQEDHKGAPDEREIWPVTDVTEEDFKTTEGVGVMKD
jgi:hypothetical protein